MVSGMSSYLPHVHFLLAHWILPYPVILNSGFPSTHEMPHVHMGPTWLSLFDLLSTRHVAQCEPFNTYHVSSDTLHSEKRVNSDCPWNLMKLDVVARFRETTLMVKSVLSFEI